MHTRTFERKPVSEWQTLSIERDATGYSVTEQDGTAGQVRVDTARLAGLAMIAASAVSWLLAPEGGAAAGVLSAAGLAFLALTCRRGTRKLQVNFSARHLCLESGAARGCGRLLDVVPFECIDSLYLRRPDHGSRGTLVLRQTGRDGEIAVMRGPLHELGSLHRKLSRDIAHAMAAEPAAVTQMPVRQVRPRRVLPRPGKRVAVAVSA